MEMRKNCQCDCTTTMVSPRSPSRNRIAPAERVTSCWIAASSVRACAGREANQAILSSESGANYYPHLWVWSLTRYQVAAMS